VSFNLMLHEIFCWHILEWMAHIISFCKLLMTIIQNESGKCTTVLMLSMLLWNNTHIIYIFLDMSITGHAFWLGLWLGWSPLITLVMALCPTFNFYHFYKFHAVTGQWLQTNSYHCVRYHIPNIGKWVGPTSVLNGTL
jgi:hypothetical protein